MADATNQHPKLITLQVTYGKELDLSLDEITGLLTNMIRNGVETLPAAKRVTIFDQYVLIEGERVTPPMLAEREAAAIAEGQAEIAADDAHVALLEADDLSPADRRALARQQKQKG